MIASSNSSNSDLLGRPDLPDENRVTMSTRLPTKRTTNGVIGSIPETVYHAIAVKRIVMPSTNRTDPTRFLNNVTSLAPSPESQRRIKMPASAARNPLRGSVKPITTLPDCAGPPGFCTKKIADTTQLTPTRRKIRRSASLCRVVIARITFLVRRFQSSSSSPAPYSFSAFSP